MADHEQPQRAIRGLTTVALLKAYYDEGKDYIDMFLPFVLDVVASLKKDDFTLEDVRNGIAERHGLNVPAHSLQTLLTRARKRNYIRRQGGRYFTIPGKLIASAAPTQQKALLDEHTVLADELQKFASARGIQFAAPADSLAAIWNFLESHHVAMLLESDTDKSAICEPDEPARARLHTRLVAEFLATTVERGGPLAAILRRMLEGYVLQNALLLKDIASPTRRFRHLVAYIDTGIMLGAIGYRGEATQRATLESLNLLRDTGARLAIFETTIDELRRILLVYEEHLRTSEGRRSLRPTDVTRFFLTKRYTPSDIRGEISLLRSSITALGVDIRAMPQHILKYTMDERALSKRLASDDSPDFDRRVTHDVDCVAGVITVRRGAHSDSLDDAGAVFATGSGLMVLNVSQWYREQGGRGVAPVIHEIALTNAAWLKRPASATDLKVAQLVALCAAALAPSPEIWKRFLRHLDGLQKSGKVTSDEVTAILATEFTDRALMEAEESKGVDWEPDAETLSEVVDRVRNTYREEGDAKVARSERKRLLAQRQYVTLRGELVDLANRIGHVGAWLIFGVLFILLALWLTVALGRAASGDVEPPSGTYWPIIAIVSTLSVLNLLFGINAWGLRGLAEDRLTRFVQRILLGRTGKSAGDEKESQSRQN